MSYILEGAKNLAPNCVADARKLIGKRVKYLLRANIDRSGRGYFFPRYGTVEGVQRRNLIIDGDYKAFSDICELIIIDTSVN